MHDPVRVPLREILASAPETHPQVPVAPDRSRPAAPTVKIGIVDIDPGTTNIILYIVYYRELYA